MKVLAAIKKFLVKEFAWIVCIAIAAFPLAYLATELVESKSAPLADALRSAFPGNSLFVVLYILTGAGLYFSRMVAGALKSLSKAKAS